MRPLDNMQRLFLDMQEHPENYSDELLEDVMDNIDRESDTEAAWQRFKYAQPTPRRWLRVAAIFVGVLTMAGIALAAVQLFTPQTFPEGDTNVLQSNEAPSGAVRGVSPVQFSNAPLDSILAVVATHYDKAVSFRDEAPRRMKLIMTWQPDAPFTDFIERLNAFDGLSLSLQNDTIFVEGEDPNSPTGRK